MDHLKRILLAEDDPADAEMTLTALAQNRLANEVVAVRDGAAALDYLRRAGAYAGRPPGHPAVVLLDLKMPKVNGLDVLTAMKADAGLRCVPVVVLTSSRESQDLAECYRLGVNAYVVKPVRFPDFVEAVRTLGVFWALINEPPCGTAARTGP